MPMFISKTLNTEVNSEAVNAIVDGMGVFRSKALEILEKNGIKNLKSGKWFKLQDFLNAFKEISTTLGPKTLFSIGSKIPLHAKFPPHIDSLEKAFESIDVAFHMNHRIKGKVLFDPQTGIMHEGIGHYIFKKLNEKEAKMTCHNAYPCDFDRGIIDGMAKRFSPPGIFVLVQHNDAAPCRKNGDESCEYIIKW